MGVFDVNKKKKIPLVPKKIAVVTSLTAAALQDNAFYKLYDDRQAGDRALVFNPEVMREESELRQRVGQKLKLCQEKYLPIVEGAIDGALKIEKPNEETEGV